MLDSVGAIWEIFLVRICSLVANLLSLSGLVLPSVFVLFCMRKYVARNDVTAKIAPVQTLIPLRMAEVV